MKQFKSLLPVFLIALLSFNLNIHAQNELGVVGKLYTSAEAYELYGPVLKRITFKTENLKQLLTRVDDYVLFKFRDNKPIIADQYRDIIYPNNAADLAPDEVMFLYSKSRVFELMDAGGAATTFIELRKEKVTVSNGMMTLEYALLCPPICW